MRIEGRGRVFRDLHGGALVSGGGRVVRRFGGKMAEMKRQIGYRLRADTATRMLNGRFERLVPTDPSGPTLRETAMSFTIYDASAPVFVNALTNIQAWLEKARAQHDEPGLMEARLAPDMRPFPAQIQMASDAAKNAMARLAGIDAPSMPDTEASFAELKDRCVRTIAFVESVDRAALDGAEDREVVLSFPNGMGYRFTGRTFLTGFALPNFFFHATTAYALLRAQGVSLGKPDFLQHLGSPNLTPAA